MSGLTSAHYGGLTPVRRPGGANLGLDGFAPLPALDPYPVTRGKNAGDIAIPLGYEQDRGKGFAPLGFTAPLADTSR